MKSWRADLSKTLISHIRRTRVFSILLVTFSTLSFLITLINLATLSYYYPLSGLVSACLSISGAIVGLVGFRVSQTLSKPGLIVYTALVAMYAVGFLGCVVVISILEYMRYLEHHPWELKTSLGVAAISVFLVSTSACWFGSWSAYTLSRGIPTVKSDSHELEPIIERTEEGPEGASSRNPMTKLPGLELR